MHSAHFPDSLMYMQYLLCHEFHNRKYIVPDKYSLKAPVAAVGNTILRHTILIIRIILQPNFNFTICFILH